MGNALPCLARALSATVWIAFAAGAAQADEPGAVSHQAEAPEPDTGGGVWLQVDAPHDGARREGRLDWVRVAGRASVGGEAAAYDVVFLVDVSASTAYASGADIDGDGRTGRTRKRLESWRSHNPRHLSSDPDDTILHAEVVGLGRLIDTLAEGKSRFGVVAYADRPEVLAPLSADRDETRQVLHALVDRPAAGGTNLAEALQGGVALLAGSNGPHRPVMVVLSDGLATEPSSAKREAKAATQAAREAAALGITIHTFSIGIQAEESVYAEIARESGGSHVRVDQPGDLLVRLPRLRLDTPPAIEIENRTTGRAARAVRVRGDGSFDGYAPLRPGENRIRITVIDGRGQRRSEDRSVHYTPRAAKDPAEAERFEAEETAFRRALEIRTVETELALEIQTSAKRSQEIEIEVESAPRSQAP